MKQTSFLSALLMFLLLGWGPICDAAPQGITLPATDQEDRFDSLSASIAVGEDHFISVGTLQSAEGPECWLIRSDASNHVIWQEKPCAERGVVLRSVTRLSSGDVVAVGYRQVPAGKHSGQAPEDKTSDAFAIRFDGNGTVAWQKRYSTRRHELLYFVDQLRDGSLLAGGRSADGVGRTAPTDGLVLILSAEDGQPQRRFTYPSGKGERAAFQDGVQVEDGGLVLVGWDTDREADSDDVWVLKADLRGSVIWQGRYGGAGDDLGHAVVALPRSEVGIVGWGTADGSDETKGLFLRLDGDGKLLTRRLYGVGTSGNDRFRDVAAADGNRLLVAGHASTSAKAPNLGWYVQLAPDGDLIGEDVLTHLTAGRLYGIALADSGAVTGVGYNIPVRGRKPDGWLVDLGRVAAVRPPATSDPRAPSEAITAPVCGEIQASDNETECPFTLAVASRVWVSVLPLDVDVDLVLTDTAGRTIGLSDNQGMAAELVEMDLAPGQYVARVSRFRGAGDLLVRFHFRMTTPTSYADTTAESGGAPWTEEDLATIERALEMVGYRPGLVDGFFSASTRQAIKSLQAALEEEPTGDLTHAQRLHLAVFAALAAETKARLAVVSTESLVREARLTQSDNASVFGVQGTRVHKLVDGIRYGTFRGEDDSYYAGIWNDRFQPEGFGSFRQGGYRKEWEWVGELADGALKGYVVKLADGTRRDIGEIKPEETSPYGIKWTKTGWAPRVSVLSSGRMAFKAHLFGSL